MLWLYSVTLFLSATLLFLIQPMVGKMILPALGGTPAVWNTCMVFFQAALLAGYALAHGSVRVLGVRRQPVLHLLLVGLAPLLGLLPLAVNLDSVPTSADNPVGWLLLRLAVGVGLPFLVIATNAPVLQMWFSQTGHPAAHDPYFLYGASNAGSLLALLGYPLCVEKYLALDDQARIWSYAYGALGVLVLVCAVVLWARRPAKFVSAEESSAARSGAAAVSGSRRARWVLLAFVPSSLMLGATTHITTDIAPIPLLWVLPLGLYILSFVIVFARRPLLTHHGVLRVFPYFVAVVAVSTMQPVETLSWLPVPAHLVALFLTALACHGALVADRPSPRYLTEFYLWLSVGGVLGGAFNALLAPVLFDSLLEYPLVLVLSAIALSQGSDWSRSRILRDAALALGVGALLVVLIAFLRFGIAKEQPPLILTIGAPAALCLGAYRVVRRWTAFGFSLAAALLAFVVTERMAEKPPLYQGRNFYGVKAVYTDSADAFHRFAHGTTVHGAQSTHPAGRRIPLTYFHPTGPVGDVFKALRPPRSSRKIGIVGLGVGTMAAYGEAGQGFVFYEIDPEVARIAKEEAYFTYLSDSKADCQIVLGDGRLELKGASSGVYDVLFLDAFTSDAVPTHLLTREAVELYLEKLAPHGMLVFNLSNRYLDLAPVLANIADAKELTCRLRNDVLDRPEERLPGKTASSFLVMVRDAADLGPLGLDSRWENVPTRPSLGVWSDQFANILSLLRWR